MPEEDIFEVLSTSDSFQAFRASVKLAGLEEALKSPGPWTLFAPTDAAFRRLPKGALDACLRSSDDMMRLVSHHVLSGLLTAEDIKDVYGRARIQGKKFTVSHGRMRVEGVLLVKPAIGCRNGIFQPIDAVLLPART